MSNERIPRLAEPKAKRKRGRRIVVLLLLFFMIVLAVLFFQSPLSKIEGIDIAGQRYTSAEAIGQALGIQIGDSFFAATAGILEERVNALPYIRSVKVEKRFPGKVAVAVEEYEEVAYTIGPDGMVKTLLANNAEVEPLPEEPLLPLPVLAHWEGHDELRAMLSKQLADIPGLHLADISEINPDPSTSYPDRIRIYTRSRFEVTTTVSYLPAKLETMRSIIGSRPPGYLTLLEADTYRPYDAEELDPDRPESESGNGGNHQ